jgi:hypothetical protein
MAYCADQENGGQIRGCRRWSTRKWTQLAGVYSEEVHRKCDLWAWNGTTLFVWGYPAEKEKEVKRLRGQASGAAQKRWKKPKPEGMPEGMPKGMPEGNSTGNAELEVEVEVERNTPKAPTGGDDVGLFSQTSKAPKITAEDIYQAYPVKAGKKEGLIAIKKAMKKIDPAELLEIVKVFAKSQEGRVDRSKIGYPQGWFNGERWTDDREVWSAWKFDGKRSVDTCTGTYVGEE